MQHLEPLSTASQLLSGKPSIFSTRQCFVYGLIYLSSPLHTFFCCTVLQRRIKEIDCVQLKCKDIQQDKSVFSTTQKSVFSSKVCTLFVSYCWLVRVSLFIELGGAGDLETRKRGTFSTFMISRPI